VRDVLSDNPAFTRSILGTAEPTRIARRLDAFCEAHLGTGLSGVLFCELSVGASFGVRLADGRRVFIKVHPPGRPSEYLEAMHEVQGYLHKRGFPCPRPMIGASPFGAGSATVDEFVETGRRADARDAGIRRAMARTLARLIELARGAPEVWGLDRGWNWPAREALWPAPHNALFDFEATAQGAGWIDGLAESAKAVVDGFRGESVIGHADWSVDQMRFSDSAVAVVYDWDSLRVDKEPVFVGIAASNFTATWHRGEPNPPSPCETWHFVGEYEAARSRPFAEKELEATAAAAIYAIAYVARCEHALDAEGRDLEGSFRQALPVHAGRYWSAGRRPGGPQDSRK
jgi:Ser/Thr protein kinase RdoA (MazF antagonist)